MTDRSHQSRRAQRARGRRWRRRQRQVRIGAAVALIVVVVGAGFIIANRGGDHDEGDRGETANVELLEFGIRGELAVPAGPVRLAATNIGAIAHNVGIRGGPITGDLRPGTSAELDLGELAAGTYELYCDIADHVELGMVASLVVTSAPPS